MTDTVRDNPGKQRFELEVEGAVAFSEYQLDPGTITFIHTEVPPALSGRGIASRLIKGALDAARARKLKVVSECSFVSAFIEKHPEYQDLLA
jgi:predicted GNAT family acetyltransferase